MQARVWPVMFGMKDGEPSFDAANGRAAVLQDAVNGLASVFEHVSPVPVIVSENFVAVEEHLFRPNGDGIRRWESFDKTSCAEFSYADFSERCGSDAAFFSPFSSPKVGLIHLSPSIAEGLIGKNKDDLLFSRHVVMHEIGHLVDHQRAGFVRKDPQISFAGRMYEKAFSEYFAIRQQFDGMETLDPDQARKPCMVNDKCLAVFGGNFSFETACLRKAVRDPAFSFEKGYLDEAGRLGYKLGTLSAFAHQGYGSVSV